LQPIGQPSRILKLATETRALVVSRLLAGDLGHVGDGIFQDLLVAHGLAHAHVQRDLGDAGNLHDVLVAELLHELRDYGFLVNLFETGAHDIIP